MKIIEKYFLVNDAGETVELQCQLTSRPSSYDGVMNDTRIELLKIRDNEIQQECEKYLLSHRDVL